jgi:hypothetical protein
MKQICFCLALLMFGGMTPLRGAAQDAATEERLNQLAGKIEDLIAAQDTQKKRIAELVREVDSLRDQANKPTGNYASSEDLKRLTEAVREVDRKRVEDNEKIRSEVRADLLSIRKALEMPAGNTRKNSTSGTPATHKAPSTGDEGSSTGGDKKGYEYVIQSGDTLGVIAQAYKDKSIKVSVDQILKANPGLDAKKMVPGKKIWIPAT